ncbi:MAG: FtsL-like putative cell division protein [Flavobacteriaceae bacterium]|nr:FtsL-like putative cell division protein [Flavobacteriaceae bacterium]
MKSGLLNLLKGTFLVQEGASKNWRFILFVFFLAGLMITASHQVDQKVVQISKANKELQAFRSEFVAVREQLMHKRMETQLENALKGQGIFPPEKAPLKIIVNRNE